MKNMPCEEREEIILHSDWKFFLGNAPDAFQKNYDDSLWRTVTIPHDWSVEEDFQEEYASGTGYLPGGLGWYRKRFFLPEAAAEKRVFITFNGVYNNSQVWCNGNNLGNRPNGYSTFCYEISEFVQPGENVLSVRADHREFIDSRWFTGSGIYRDVILTIVNRECFLPDGIFAFVSDVKENHAEISVEWDACTQADAEVKLFFAFPGKQEAKSGGTGSSGKALVSLPDPEFWSPKRPALYTLRAELWREGRRLDRVELPFGVRTFRFDPQKGFFLNGENQKLKGVCLHHDAGALGAAVPREVWQRRLEKLKIMGCNAIRTSHNPPDPVFLDLCDELGFLVMDEAFDEWEGCKNKWWKGHNVYPPKHEGGYSEHFPVWHERDLSGFVRRDRNHPCVILWSIGNEVDYPNDPYSYPLPGVMEGNNDKNKPAEEMVYDSSRPSAKRLGAVARELAAIVRRNDPTRPVTAAIAYPEVSELTGYTGVLDAVGYNYKEHLYQKALADHPERVLFGSENFHDAPYWTAVRDNDAICGQFLWTGADYLGEASGWPVRASKAGNLTLAGIEKPRYFHRKALWCGGNTLVLAARPEGSTEDEFRWNWEEGEMMEVSAYTNCGEIELFLNGASFGKKPADPQNPGRIVWRMPFVPGTLLAKGMREGKPVEAKLSTAGSPAQVVLAPWRDAVPADGRTLVQVELSLADGDGIPAMHQDLEVKWQVCGDAALIGVESGAVDDVTPYRVFTRKTFRGRMIAYFRAGRTPGAIRISARAGGCQEGEALIHLLPSP